MPLKHAMDLVLTGRRIGASKPKPWGLINDVVPAAELARTRQVAEMIIAGAPLAIEASKQVMLQSLEMGSRKRRCAPAIPPLSTCSPARTPRKDSARSSRSANHAGRAASRHKGYGGNEMAEFYVKVGDGALLQDGRRIRRLQLRRHHRRLSPNHVDKSYMENRATAACRRTAR